MGDAIGDYDQMQPSDGLIRVGAVIGGLVAWTFLVASCAGVVSMSGAHSRSGEWPVGATITLLVLGLAWILLPLLLWRRRRARAR